MRKTLKEKLGRHRSSSPSGAIGLGLSLSRFAFSTSSRNLRQQTGCEPDPLGLSLIADPEHPTVDIIFVHGLGGTSRNTWCKDKNPELFWPKIWLPEDLPRARIHTYGYNANFASNRDSIYGTLDFSKQLLFDIAFSLQEFGKYPIVFVAHSMGGLVVKKLYTLARQDPQYQKLVPKFFGILFLATPHRGSNSAQTLQNLLSVSFIHSKKAYVDDLATNSVALQTINEDFRHVASNLKLFSFYESLKTPAGPISIMVVEKDSASLGYSGEVSVALNADHHTICKFSGAADPNYIAVRNALVALVRQCEDQVSDFKKENHTSQMEIIYKLLSYRESPEDDLLKYRHLRLRGSCEWITKKEYFRGWLDSGVNSQILWLNAIPASGKSVLSAYIIDYIGNKGKDCQYFFFHHGETAFTSESFLRSLAIQLAGCYDSVRKGLVALYNEHIRLGDAGARMIWQKVFVATILRIQFAQPLYWVIDALDESESSLAIVQMLGDVHLLSSSFRILVLSRFTDPLASAFQRLRIPIVIESITVEDTLPDIRSYVAHVVDTLPGDQEIRQKIIGRVLEKSAGCFLWVRLAIEEVQDLGHTQASIEAAIEDMPAEMDRFYQRAIDTISGLHSQNQCLAREIIRWAICSIRPLTLDELSYALRPDVGQIIDLERTIVRTCAHLLFVDHRRRVLPVHQTVRDFLLKSVDTKFGIDQQRDHEKLSQMCLEFLNKDLQSHKFHRAQEFDQRNIEQTPILGYAASSWSDHLRIATASSEKLLDSLVTFLQNKILYWVAFISSCHDLRTLTRTVKNMKAFLERQTNLNSLAGTPRKSDFELVQLWAVDLSRLATKFGKNLSEKPSAIFKLVPPLCPKQTMIYRQFGALNKTLSVSGLSVLKWNDCISRIPMRETITAIACGDIYLALALSSGTVVVLNVSTYQETRKFEHSEYILSLAFNSTSAKLLSGGTTTVRVWDINTGRQTNIFSPGNKVLSVEFSPQGTTAWSVSCGNIVKAWDLLDGCETCHFEWGQSGTSSQYHGFPVSVALYAEHGQVAVSYRGLPVGLWEVGSHVQLGEVIRGTSPGRGNPVSQDTAFCMDFNRVTGHLILGYHDGTMLKWNPITGEQQDCDADAQTLSCSKNGTTIGTGDSFGNIKLWDFTTLKLIHQISTCDPIQYICFSPDGLRFYDIRDTYCSAWEPDALVRAIKPDNDDQSSFDPVLAEFTNVVMAPERRLCSLVCDPSGEFCAYGRDDGCIYVSSATTGEEIQKLYSHASTVSVVAHIWGASGELMATADNSRRFILQRIIHSHPGSFNWQTAVLIDSRARSSIRNLLLTPDEKRLLVFTPSDCEIWTVEGLKLQSITFSANHFSMWINHPLEPPQFLCLETHHVESTPFNKQRRISPENIYPKELHNSFQSLQIQMPEHGDSYVTKVIPSLKRDFLIVEVSPKAYAPGTVTIMLWDSANLIQQPQQIVSRAESLIGVSNRKIVFLNKDLWVCSWDIDNIRRTSHEFDYEKHFFLPQDWMDGSEAQRCALTPLGSIVFVVRGELVVVKSGLNLSQMLNG